MRPPAPETAEVSIPARFRRLHAGDRGLIAAPWTPLASLCFPLRERKKKADLVRLIDQADSHCNVELKTRNP
jgi:hypothetical protein